MQLSAIQQQTFERSQHNSLLILVVLSKIWFCFVCVSDDPPDIITVYRIQTWELPFMYDLLWYVIAQMPLIYEV